MGGSMGMGVTSWYYVYLLFFFPLSIYKPGYWLPHVWIDGIGIPPAGMVGLALIQGLCRARDVVDRIALQLI